MIDFELTEDQIALKDMAFASYCLTEREAGSAPSPGPNGKESAMAKCLGSDAGCATPWRPSRSSAATVT
jgi:hypothetical protein